MPPRTHATPAGGAVRALLGDSPLEQALRDLRSDFEHAQPGQTASLAVECYPLEEAAQRAEYELRSGSGRYTVVAAPHDRAPAWLEAGWAQPVAADDATDFVPAALATFQRGGRQLALPWRLDVQVLAYRADLLERAGLAAPRTFSDLDEVCRRGQGAWRGAPGAPVAPLGLATTPVADAACWSWPAFLQGLGGHFLANPPTDVTPMVAQPVAVESATLWARLVAACAPPAGRDWLSTEVGAALGRGQVALALEGTVAVAQAAQTLARAGAGARLAVAPVPAGATGSVPQLRVEGLLAPAASAIDLAQRFFAWALAPATLRRAAQLAALRSQGATAGTLPRISLLYEQLGGAAPWGLGAAEVVLEACAAARPAYRLVPEFPALGNRVAIALADVLRGRPAGPTMADANATLRDILEKAGRKLERWDRPTP